MKVVIVGGGFGGLKTALELANNPGFEITLISERPNFEYHGALYRSGTGRSPLEVVMPLRDILKGVRNITFAQDRIVGIDAGKQRVVSETGNVYSYDKLILALGNVVNYFGIAGMDETTMSLDTISNTIALRHQLVELFKSNKPVLHIVVAGAGPAGVELAGELQHFAQIVAEKYKLQPKRLKVVIIEGANRALPGLKPAASYKALRRLERLGVKVMLNTQLNSCEPGKVCLDGGDLSADLIIWTAGSRAPGFYADHPNVFKLERGRVKVDQYLKAAGQESIYVIGDNAATPYAGMAQTALHDAKFVARNLIRELGGKKLFWYRAQIPVYAVPIGPNWAILQTSRRVMSGRRAWLVRRRADLAIYRNFKPYKEAVKTWRKGNKLARF